MALTVCGYAMVDESGDIGYKGVTVPIAVGSAADVTTFAQVLENYSDCLLVKSEIKEAEEFNPLLAGCGPTAHHKVGYVKVKDTTNGRTWAVPIPGIADSAIVKNVKADDTLSLACQAAVLGAFAGLSGIAVESLKVIDSWISYQNKRRR